jgi:hypothetical protein
MIKLTDIIREMKVNIPSSTKAYFDLRNLISRRYSWSILNAAIQSLNKNSSNPVKFFLKDWYDWEYTGDDINDLRRFLEEDFGMEDEDEINELIKILLNFFKSYKANDFHVKKDNDNMGDLKQYKYLDYLGVYDRDESTEAMVVSNKINIGENEAENEEYDD